MRDEASSKRIMSQHPDGGASKPKAKFFDQVEKDLKKLEVPIGAFCPKPCEMQEKQARTHPGLSNQE